MARVFTLDVYVGAGPFARMVFDASPWGTGFLVVDGKFVSWFAAKFDEVDEKAIGIRGFDVCLRSLSNPEQWTCTIACDPRCKWGVKGDLRSCVWENYVLTCMCWHVAVNWSVPCLVPRMSEFVGYVAWFVVVGLQIAWRPACIRGGVVKMVVGTVCWLLFCGCVSWALYGGGGGVMLGRQAAWRPGCNRCVSSDCWWHCAVCWSVIACYLGSV